MPELPEVENTVRFLRERVRGRSIVKVTVGWPRIIDRPKSETFIKELRGCLINDCSRRGKFIIMHILKPVGKKAAIEYSLLAHMRMSGSFDVVTQRAERSKHDHVVIQLDNGKEIRFHDPRKFGRFYLVVDSNEIVGHLGYEPLEKSFQYKHLMQIFSASKAASKATLLNQGLIAGVGNIYADESLWAAGIDPRKPANKVKEEQVKKLAKEIKRILRQAIAANGTDNGDGVVEGGMYSPKAYGRGGTPCSRCGTLFKRIVIVQRGTSYCPSCQK